MYSEFKQNLKSILQFDAFYISLVELNRVKYLMERFYCYL